MTLIIGTVSKNCVVLTADGLSVPNPLTGQGVSSSNYQKIFPLPGVPVAVAHYGPNILNKRGVAVVIDDFAAQHTDSLTKNSVVNVARALFQFVNPHAQLTLQDPTNKGIIGFWVAGFSQGSGKAKLYEIYWPNEVEPKSCRGLVLVGDGKKFIEPYLKSPLGSFHPDKVYTYTSDDAHQYHDSLYEVAESEQSKQGEGIFGGKKQQLIIRRKGWTWTVGPP